MLPSLPADGIALAQALAQDTNDPPAIVSVPLAFLVAVAVSLASRSATDTLRAGALPQRP